MIEANDRSNVQYTQQQDNSPTTTASSVPAAVPERWNDEQFAEMAQLWKLSDKEQSQMRQLQHQLADIQHWKNDPFEVVRYLRDFGSVDKAATLFRRMVEWRMREDMDHFLDRYGEPPPLFQYFPIFVCQGLDRDGDPIYVERTGAGDPYGLIVAHGGSVEPLAEYAAFIREMTTTRRRPGEPNNTVTTPQDRFCWQRDYYEPLMKRRMTQFTVIMDMEGLNHRHLRGGLLGLAKRMARISQDYYAGMGKRVILLRAPAIFEWGWNHIVKHFFDPHVRDLIVFTGPDDYLQIMDQYIDITVLPACLAPGYGTGKAMPGYFETIHMEGGPIPPAVVPNTRQDTKTTTVTVESHRGHWEKENPNESHDNSKEIDNVQPPTPKSRVTSVLGVSLLKGQWDDEYPFVEPSRQPTKGTGASRVTLC